MLPTIAILAPGAMGAAIGARLVAAGVVVLTSVKGRGPGSVSRAKAAGLRAVADREIASADIILSVVPPADALAVAERFAVAIAAGSASPLFVDCNAVDVTTVRRIGDAAAAAGARFVDACIIGGPPKPGTEGPRVYVSGEGARELEQLRPLGVDVRLLEGPVGAASALKMSYAGITKGLTGLAAVMVLGAARAGASGALLNELAESQPALLARFATALPDMIPKAGRWSGEMREIAAFLSDMPAATAVFEGMAAVYDALASDDRGSSRDVDVLRSFATSIAPA